MAGALEADIESWSRSTTRSISAMSGLIKGRLTVGCISRKAAAKLCTTGLDLRIDSFKVVPDCEARGLARHRHAHGTTLAEGTMMVVWVEIARQGKDVDRAKKQRSYHEYYQVCFNERTATESVLPYSSLVKWLGGPRGGVVVRVNALGHRRILVQERDLVVSSRTPEGEDNRCPVCGQALRLEPSRPPGDAPCPYCGVLVWFPHSVNEWPLPSAATSGRSFIGRAGRKMKARLTELAWAVLSS